MTDEQNAAMRSLPRLTDIDALANGLSETMSNFLSDDPQDRKIHNHATERALAKRGLVERKGRFVRPTPVGRMVVQQLKEGEE